MKRLEKQHAERSGVLRRERDGLLDRQRSAEGHRARDGHHGQEGPLQRAVARRRQRARRHGVRRRRSRTSTTRTTASSPVRATARRSRTLLASSSSPRTSSTLAVGTAAGRGGRPARSRGTAARAREASTLTGPNGTQTIEIDAREGRTDVIESELEGSRRQGRVVGRESRLQQRQGCRRQGAPRFHVIGAVDRHRERGRWRGGVEALEVVRGRRTRHGSRRCRWWSRRPRRSRP